MIDAMLSKPEMRIGVPRFQPRDEVIEGVRLKRVRQWSSHKGNARILPWIALNPSGFNTTGRGLSGTTMARLAYLWGFDGVATYNIIPFEGSNPKRDIWPIIQESGSQPRIQQAHVYIANDLVNADAILVGWGSKRGSFGAHLDRLARQLVIAINAVKDRKPIKLWHVGLNGDGAPKHAGARGIYRIADDARPARFSFHNI